MPISSLPNFSPEFCLLLASALYPLAEGEIARLQSACRQAIDWTAFSALVRRHRLTPTVYQNLSRHASENVPRAALDDLRKQADLNRQQVVKILAESGRLLQWLAGEGIPTCILKGPLLAQRLFGDAALRTSSDLDLLIEPESLPRTDALLLSLGCQRVLPDADLEPKQWRAFQRQWYNSTYLLPVSNTYVEIHWTIASPDLIDQRAVHQMFARARPLAHSAGFPTLANEDLAAYLLIHGSKHNWVRLKWLVDFVTWLRAAEIQDLPTLRTQMTELGLQRSLGQGLFLANWLFSDPIPEALQPWLANEPAARRLANLSLKAILDPAYAGTETEMRDKIRLTLYKLQLKSSLGYKLATLNRLARPWLWMGSYYLRLHREHLAAPHAKVRRPS